MCIILVVLRKVQCFSIKFQVIIFFCRDEVNLIWDVIFAVNACIIYSHSFGMT